MSQNRIVIVLGAGASKAVSQKFGIGCQLIEEIISQSKNPSGDTRPKSDNYIGRVFDELIKNLNDNRIKTTANQLDLTFETRLKFSNELTSYKKEEGAKASIDSFLNLPNIINNSSYQFIARFFIFINIMGYEGACMGEAAFQRKSWLNVLANFVQEHSLFQNNSKIKLDIITFNYDRLVEEFLYRTFGNLIIPFTDANIHHVYDKVGELPWQIKDEKSLINPIIERIINFGHPNFDNLRIFSNLEKIRLITDQRQNEDVQKTCSELIHNANNVIIIGFAFDSLNVSRIGLNNINPKRQNIYAHLFIDKSKSNYQLEIDEKKATIPDNLRDQIQYGYINCKNFLSKLLTLLARPV